MPTTSPTTRPRHLRAALMAAVVLVLAIAGTLAAVGEPGTAAGVLCGAAVTLLLVAFAGRRMKRAGADAPTAARVFGGLPDERDAAVLTGALTVVGLVALLTTALAPIAVSLGLDAETVLGALPYLLLATGLVAFVVIDRRT